MAKKAIPDLPGLVFDPEEFLRLCRNSAGVPAAIEADDAEALLEAVNDVYEEAFLVALLEAWDSKKKRVAAWVKYRLAQGPKDGKKLRFPRPDPRKLYFWKCKDCGDRCGIHYYPVDWCRNCQGQNIVRQTTNSPMGYPGKRLLNRIGAE